MKEVVIASACRTAIGTAGGALKDAHAATLAKATMKEAIQRTGIEPGMLNDVRYGCCLEPPETFNVARVAAQLAGIPDHVPAVTINRVCISGMESVISGMAMIQAGMADIILAGGVEHMSGIAQFVPNSYWGHQPQNPVLVDRITTAFHCGSHLIPHPEDGPVKSGFPLEHFKGTPYNLVKTAELTAQLHNISRQEMDEIALQSHHKAEKATLEGHFQSEIVPVEIPSKGNRTSTLFNTDEHFRKGLTMEDLVRLSPILIPEQGKVTAGNAAGINDGSSGMVIMSADKANELSIQPLAKIRGIGLGACHSSVMGLSPVPAVHNLLSRHPEFKLNDFELIEIHEAFGATYLAVEKELDLDREKTNINGSGIGLGHPIGSTGCRIMVTLVYAMKRLSKTLGLATLCGGGGVSMACALETIS